MAAMSQVKSISIRRRESVDDDPNHGHHPAKIQRLDSPDGMVSPTKIINLNVHCLIEVFRNLDLTNLFNVALASKWLRPAAAEVYHRIFGIMTVKICDCHKEIDAGTYRYSSFLEVYGLKTCLQFLRCFGSSISALSIDYNESDSKRYQYVHQYVNDFCAGSLHRIRFRDMLNMDIIVQQGQSIFSNVKAIDIWHCNLAHLWPSIGACFPNVKILNLVCNDWETANTIQEPLQNLKGIRIDATNAYRPEEFSETVENLLQNAPHLKRFEVTTSGDPGIPMRTLLAWTKHNQSISRLIMEQWYLIEAIEVTSEEVQQLITEHQALNALDLGGYRFTVDDAIAMIREMNELEQFYFQMEISEFTHFVDQLDTVWKVYSQRHHADDNSIFVELKR